MQTLEISSSPFHDSLMLLCTEIIRDQEELQKQIDMCDLLYGSHDFAVGNVLRISNGSRCSEWTELTIKDIDCEKGLITILEGSTMLNGGLTGSCGGMAREVSWSDSEPDGWCWFPAYDPTDFDTPTWKDACRERAIPFRSVSHRPAVVRKVMQCNRY